jgi:putative oxidoreductase
MFKSFPKCYYYLILIGGILKSPLLLLCRLYFGWIFFSAGIGKLNNIDEFVELLKSYHLYAPTFQAYVAALIEVIGGSFLIIGLASRLVAIPLIIVMMTAYSTVHIESIKSIFSDPALFVAQSAFNPLLITFFIFSFGPGRYSLDFLLEKYFFHKC